MCARVLEVYMNRKLLIILLAVVVVSASLALFACGEDSVIDYIELYSAPKAVYTEGEALDISNASIRVVYNDGSEEVVQITPDMISGFNPNTIGKQYLKIYYEGSSTTFVVTVQKEAVVSVVPFIPEGQTDYIEGQNLNLTGAYLTVVYANNVTEKISITEDMISGYDKNLIGEQDVYITCDINGEEYVHTFRVNVVKREISGIEIDTLPTKNIYYLGDTIDLVGGVLFVRYDSGYSEKVAMTDAYGEAIDGLEATYDFTKVNSNCFVTITYGYKTTRFSVDVKIRDVEEYEILVAPQEQIQNLELDMTGTVVKVIYNNGESETITLPSEQIRVEGYDKTNASELYQTATLVFSYGGVELAKRGEIAIKIIQEEAVGIEIVKKATVYQDTAINPDLNWKYVLIYNNGNRSEEFDFNSSMIDWGNSTAVNSYAEVGNQTWHIVYSSAIDVYFDFEVEALEVTNIEFVGAEDVIAYLGGDVVIDGITMDVTYNNGETVTGVALEKSMITFDNTSVGLKVVTVDYSDEYEDSFLADFYATVVKKINNITLTQAPKTQYVLHEAFDPTDLIIEVNYDGSYSSQTVKATDANFANEWTFEVEDVFTKVGEQTVYLLNKGCEGALEITVNVTNELIAIGPIYQRIENPLTGEKDLYIEQGYFGQVVAGSEINLEDYFLLLTFEGKDINNKEENYTEYFALTSAQLDYQKTNTTLGERSVTVYYPSRENAEYTLPSSVTVVNRSVVGIRIVSAPTKVNYVYTANGTTPLDTAGMKVSLVYDNDTSTTLDVEAELDSGRLATSGFDSGKVGEQTIRVSYNYQGEYYEDTFKVTVIDSAVKSMVWNTNYGERHEEIYWENGTMPSTEIPAGTEFDLASITTRKVGEYPMMSLIDNTFVTITYDNDVSETVALNTIYRDMSVVDYSKEARTVQYVKLYYGDAYVTIVTYISERKLASISLTEDSPALTAIQGADVRLGNAKLRLVYESGAPTIIPMSLDYINYDAGKNPNGYDKETAVTGTYPVTIVYTLDGITKSCQVDITVSAPQLIKIEINEVPKIDYIEGEAFRPDGQLLKGSIVLTYDNGKTEVKQLADATENSSSSTFNINTINFNSQEFSGYNKSQRITVTYMFDEKPFTTGYNVIIHDRKYVETIFNAGNKYEFTYGEGEAPILDLKGYNTFNSEERELTVAKDNYKVKYVPASVWEELGVARFDDEYTAFPTMAGTYYIVVYYPGDAIHNEYTDDSQKIIINKKALYISFEPMSKIYGTNNPEIRLVLKSSKNAEVLEDPTTLFVTGDSFTSPNFNASPVEYNSICYLVYGSERIELNMFDIVFLNGSGEEVAINNLTNVSTYYVNVRTPIDSPNYEITYENATFEVVKRKVNVIPISASYEYGEGMPRIGYTTTAVDGVADSGIVNDDEFEGVLYREDADNNNVGKYLITKGTLKNNNYEIIFVNEEGADAKYMEITPRNIKVRANSTSMVTLVDDIPVMNITFYREIDDVANTNNVFARGDSEEIFKRAYVITHAEDVSRPGEYTLSVEYKESVLTEEELAVVKNYNVTTTSGTLTVNKMPVTVTAIATSKEYGEIANEDGTIGDPALEYVVTVSEEIAVKLGYSELTEEILNTAFAEPIAFSGGLKRDIGEEVGSYKIVIGDLNCEYFAINFVSARFDIVSKHVVISVAEDALGKYYDGKEPQIASYTLYDSNDKSISGTIANDIKEAINFTFTNGSKNHGSYPVNVASKNNSYTFSLAEEYVYVISRKSVSISYVDLPDGEEYKGDAYVVSAIVPEEQRACEYDYDGTPKEDSDGNVIRDEVSVVLSLTSATTVGEYKTKALSLSNDNYYLEEANNQEVTFNIIPRKIYINLNTDATLVFEKEYDGFEAQIYANDCILKVNGEVVTNTVFGEPIPAFALSVGNSASAPSEVLYDENGAINAYSINIKENSSDKNFEFVLADEYKYRIIPKTVTVSIPSNELSKEYDGQQPRINAYTISETDANVSSQSLIFSFTRETASDGKDNTAVGRYGVTLTCRDLNYAVYLSDTYIYEITKSTVAFSVLTASKTRVYNGQNASLTYNDINFPRAFSGDKPYVRNFMYGTGNSNFLEFQSKLETITNLVATAKSDVTNVDSKDIASQQLALETAIESVENAYYAIQNHDNGYDKVITEENFSNLENSLSNAYNRLRNAVSELTNSVQNAVSEYLTAKSAIDNAFRIIERENSYLAFIFGTEGTTSAKDKGSYIMQSVVSDYNRDFTITGFNVDSNRTYTITAKTLSVKVEDIEVTYGDYNSTSPEPDINYSLVDPMTGLDYFIDEATGIRTYFIYDAGAIGNPKRSEPTNFNAGEYNILIGDVAIENTNYDLSITISAKYTIKQALLTIMLNDMGYTDTKVYYGDAVGVADIGNSGYQYIEPNLDYTEKIGKLAGIEAGDSEVVKLEKLRAAFGGLRNGENFADVIKTDLIKYLFYVSEEDKTSLLGEIVGVGEYVISATDIYTHKQPGAQIENYVVKIIPGSIKISRRPLTIKYQDSNRWIYKTYGDSTVDLEFEGNIDDNLEKLMVYAINSTTGELTPTGYTLGSFDFLSKKPEHSIANSRARDPLTAFTGATLPVYLDASGYCLENYDFSINNETEYSLYINKANLTLNVLAMNGTNRLSTIYGEAPEYKLVYNGLKNEETAEELGLDIGGAYAPVIDFRVMAGRYNIGTEAVGNVISVNFISEPQNYIVDFVQTTEVEVAKRTVYVYIDGSRYSDGKLPAMYDSNSPNGVDIFPYIVQINYEKVTEGQEERLEARSAEITSGAYSYLDFRLCLADGSEGIVTAPGYNDKLEEMFRKYASMTEAAFGPTDTTGMTRTIIGAYDKTYVHDLVVNISTHTAQLSGMILTDTYKNNYDLKYKAMPINLYSHITALNVDASQYLIYGQDDARDVIKMSGIDELLQEHEFTMSSPYITKTAQNIPTSANQNGYIKVRLDKSYVIYAQDPNFVAVHEGFTARFGSTFSSNAVVTNKSIGEKTIVVRYYNGSKQTIETVSPTFTDSLGNGIKYRDALEEGVYTAGDATYDRINLTARFKVGDYASAYNFKLLINGTFEKGMWIEFNNSNNNYVSIAYNYSGTIKYVQYKLPANNLFDGNAHNIKVYLEKRAGTVRIAVDNKSGAIQSVSGVVDVISDIVENSSVAFETTNVTMYLRKFAYATQGYNDNVGTFIRPQVDGENTLVVSVSSGATSATINTTDMFDSAVPTLENYVIKYYVNNGSEPTVVKYGDTAARLTLEEGKNAVVALLYEVNGETETLLAKDVRYVKVSYAPAEVLIIKDNDTFELSGNNVLRLFEKDENVVSEDVGSYDGSAINYELKAIDANDDFMPITALEVTTKIERTKLYHSQSGQTVYELQNSERQYPISISMFNTASWGDVTQIGSSGRGISLKITRTQSESSYSFATDLVAVNKYVLSGNTVSQTGVYRFSQSINYDDGATYTFGIYADRIGNASGNVDDMGALSGNVGIKVIIYRNGTPIADEYIDNNTEMKLGTSYSEAANTTKVDVRAIIENALKSGVKTYTSIYGFAHKLTLYNVVANPTPEFDNDYLIDGNYVMRNEVDGNVIGDTANTSVVAQSDARNNTLFSSYNNMLVKFKLNDKATQDASYEIDLKSIYSRLEADNKRGVKLVATNDKLVFVFYDGENAYLAQEIDVSAFANGMLEKDKLYTITASFDGARRTTSSNLVREGVSLTAFSESEGFILSYGAVTITISDGINSTTSECYFPYFNSGYGWYTDIYSDAANGGEGGYIVDTASINYMKETNVRTVSQFVTNYSYSAITLNGVEITLYNYDTARGNLIEDQTLSTDSLVPAL